ncbi:hypothetical protein CKO_02823 [Citrobacter koseri ATCC BAA-895]|uniref:Uncharacterized protein n=1 Tax=Citrobacter koseri (strain ATCC BAA-895 / CDC 4225-83 / SGSC4696) TaxID=290338 RepID=A8AKB6_CITK8|nr:hypothetical protein CKO_02823 [Citrobacter koseri ATCC BAA-895]
MPPLPESLTTLATRRRTGAQTEVGTYRPHSYDGMRTTSGAGVDISRQTDVRPAEWRKTFRVWHHNAQITTNSG